MTASAGDLKLLLADLSVDHVMSCDGASTQSSSFDESPLLKHAMEFQDRGDIRVRFQISNAMCPEIKTGRQEDTIGSGRCYGSYRPKFSKEEAEKHSTQ